MDRKFGTYIDVTVPGCIETYHITDPSVNPDKFDPKPPGLLVATAGLFVGKLYRSQDYEYFFFSFSFQYSTFLYYHPLVYTQLKREYNAPCNLFPSIKVENSESCSKCDKTHYYDKEPRATLSLAHAKSVQVFYDQETVLPRNLFVLFFNVLLMTLEINYITFF